MPGPNVSEKGALDQSDELSSSPPTTYSTSRVLKVASKSMLLALAILCIAYLSKHPLLILQFFTKGLASARKPSIPDASLTHWMSHALTLFPSPCPHYPFSALLVNHSSTSATQPHGALLCTGVNAASRDPTLHGEIAALQNCSALLSSPVAWTDLTLYSTAEPCTMCAAAIRWAGVGSVVYGVSVDYLVEKGWAQFEIRAEEVFKKSGKLNGGRKTALISDVLGERIRDDGLFRWQFDNTGTCPMGCVGKDGRRGTERCVPSNEGKRRGEL